MTVSGKTKLRDLKRMSAYQYVAPYLIYGHDMSNKLMQMGTLDQMTQGAWSKESILHGLDRLAEVAVDQQCLHRVYTVEEYRGDKQKRDVSLIHFPVQEHGKPAVIICAGGAYTNVCSLAEGFPVAARLNELGYPAFVLTYRVGGRALMPKPLEDLASAVRYVFRHAGSLGVSSSDYIIAGFSAGANLACLWGTDNHGYRVYGLPKPLAMFPVYPLLSPAYCYPGHAAERISQTMFGMPNKASVKLDYNVDEHMSADYPPCYIVCCKDDDVVPPENSLRLKKQLEQWGIPAELEQGEKGGHGFGEGIGTDVAGWVDRAVFFAERCRLN